MVRIPATTSVLWGAPEPAEVLKRYIDAVSPMSWSGSRADIMSQRIAALSDLDKSKSDDVTKLLDEQVPRLLNIVEKERERETNRQSEQEQRFE